MSKEKVSHGRNAARFKQAASIFFIIQYQQLLQTADFNDPQWLYRGNVYGAGSGITKYAYDFKATHRHGYHRRRDHHSRQLRP